MMVRHPVLTMTHFRDAVRGMRGKEHLPVESAEDRLGWTLQPSG